MSGRRRQLTVERSPVIAWNVQTFHGAPYPDMPAAAAISPVVPAASDPYGRCWQNQVDAGSCFPYFANIYSSSLPPPSSFRVQPSCVTNLGQFWPPTPPPDGCGRYEASSNFYFCPPPMTPVFSHNEAIPQSIHGSLPRLSHYSHIIETPKEHNIHSSGLKLENPLSPKCSLPHMIDLCPPVSKYEVQNSVQVSDPGLKKPDSHQSSLCSQATTNREKSAQKIHYNSCNYMECEGRNHSGDLIRGSDKENIHNPSSYNSYNPDHRSANGKLKQKNCEIAKENPNFLHFKNSNFQPNQNTCFSSSQNSMLNNYKEHTSLQCGVAPSALDSLNKNANAMEVSNVHCSEEVEIRRGIENSVPVSQPVTSMMTTVSAIPVSGLPIGSTSSSMIARSNCSRHSSHVPRSGYNACSSIPLQIQMFSDTPISHRKSCCFSPPHALSSTFFQHPVTDVPKSNLKQNSYMSFGSNYNSSPLKNVYFSYLESENVAKYASKGSKLIGKNMSLNSEKYAINMESPYEDAKLMSTATEKIGNSCGGISNSDGTSNNYINYVVECPLEHQQKCISLSGTSQRSEKRKFEEVMFVSDQKKKSRRVKVKTEKNETADCRFQKSSECALANHEGPSISNALNLSLPKSPKSEPQDVYLNQDKISLNSGHLTSSSASVSCGIPVVNTIVPLEDFQNFNGNNDFNDAEKDIPLSYCPIPPRVSEANISNLEYASVGYSTVQSDLKENVSENLAPPREMTKSGTYIKSGTSVSSDLNDTTAVSKNSCVKTDNNVSVHVPGTSHKPGNCCMMQNCFEKSKKYDEYSYCLEQDKVEKENLTTCNMKSSDTRSLDLTCGSSSLCESGKSSRDSNFAMLEVLPACVEKSNGSNRSLFPFNFEDSMGVNKDMNFGKNGDYGKNDSPELASKCIQSEICIRTKDLVTDSALLLQTKFENPMICESELNSEASSLLDDSKKCAPQVQGNLPPGDTNVKCESSVEQNADENTDLCHSDELCCGDSHPHEVVTDVNVNASKECKYTNVSLGEKLNKFSFRNCDQQSNALEFSENHGLNLLIHSIEQMERNQNDDNGKNSNSLTKSHNSGKVEPRSYEENDYSGTHLLPCSDAPTPVVCGLDLLCALVEQHYFSEFNVEIKSSSSKEVNSFLINSPVVKCESTNSKYSLNQAAEESSESTELEMRKRLAELQRKYKEKQKELARLKSKKIFSRIPNKGGKVQSCKNFSVMNEETSVCPWAHSHMQTDGNNLGREFSSCSMEISPVEKSLKSEVVPTLDNELFMHDAICETRKLHDHEISKQPTNKHSKCGYEEQTVSKEICNTKKQNSRFSNVLGLNEDGYNTRRKLRNSKLCSVHLKKNQNFPDMDKIIVSKTRQVAKKGSLNIDLTRIRSSVCRMNKTRRQKTLPGGVQREKLQQSEDYYEPSALNLPRSLKRVKGLSNVCVVTPICEGSGSLDPKCSRPVSNKRKADNPRKFSLLKQENVTETLVTKQLRNRILINEELPGQNEQDGTNGISEELFDAFRKCHLGEDPNSSNTSCKIIENALDGDVDSNLKNNRLDLVQELSMLKPSHLSEKQRVVAMEDGLFYAGHIKVIQPPDVYGIVLDGERGTKPHVFSREEIMKAAMLEVKPKSIDELPERTRVCAYWSQQYRCLYPGTVAKASKAKTESTEPWVFVEFDDGDSGQIPIKNIRLLPPNLKLSFADEELKDIPSEQVTSSFESSTTKLPSNRKRKTQREKPKIHQKHKLIKKELTASSQWTAPVEMLDSNDDLRNNSEGNSISSHTSDSRSTENGSETTHPYTSDLSRKSPRKSLIKISKRKGSKAKSKEIVLLEKSKKHKEKRKHHHHHHHHHRHHHHRHHRHCHHHHHCKKHKRRKKGDLNSTVSQGNTDLVIPSNSIPDKNLSCKLSCHSLEGDCNDFTGHSSLELPQSVEKSSSTDTRAKMLQQKSMDEEECESKPVLRRNHRSIQKNSAKFNRGIA